MKKAFALIMAIAMIASMAAVSFAANTQIGTVGEQAWGNIGGALLFRVGANNYEPATLENVPYGETLYIALEQEGGQEAITSADAVSGLKVSAKWTANGDYVESVEIVKKDSRYFIAINTAESTLTTAKEVEGELTLSGKAYAAADAEKKTSIDKVEIPVVITLQHTAADDLQVVAAGTTALYDYTDVDEEEYEIAVGNDITVETYMKNTKKVVFSYDEEENDELLDAYVDANLDFYNCNMTFRRTATVTLAAAEGSYLYEVVDGELVEVDAEYDEWEEAFVWKTRTLGNYVVSDVELEVAAEEVVVTNPSTGAAA